MAELDKEFDTRKSLIEATTHVLRTIDKAEPEFTSQQQISRISFGDGQVSFDYKWRPEIRDSGSVVIPIGDVREWTGIKIDFSTMKPKTEGSAS